MISTIIYQLIFQTINITVNYGYHGMYYILCISFHTIQLLAIIPHTHGSLFYIDKIVNMSVSNIPWIIVMKKILREVLPPYRRSIKSSRYVLFLIPKNGYIT